MPLVSIFYRVVISLSLAYESSTLEIFFILSLARRCMISFSIWVIRLLANVIFITCSFDISDFIWPVYALN